METPEVQPVTVQQPANNERLGKRLAYILRYGAKKEGLSVSEKGYVNLSELMTVDLLKDHTATEVLHEVDISESICSGKKRFEKKTEHGQIFVRASYGRKFEPNPFHDGTQVKRLMEVCLSHICRHIADYSLEEFPDEYVVREVIHRMRREKRLTNKALENIVGPSLELLDLEGVFITEKTLTIVKKQGGNLRNLSLRGSGYLITDHNFIPLIKKLPNLETLDISGCSHLTSKSFSAIPAAFSNIRRLLLSNIDNLSEEVVMSCLDECQNLKYLQAYGNEQLTKNGSMARILKRGKERGVFVAMHLTSKDRKVYMHPNNIGDGD